MARLGACAWAAAVLLLPAGARVAARPEGAPARAPGACFVSRGVAYSCTVTTFLGGNRPTVGDGGPATEAWLDRPFGVLAASDGSVYITDSRHDRVRRVGPDGIIRPFAGNGSAETQGDSIGDGGPAEAAKVRFPRLMAEGPD